MPLIIPAAGLGTRLGALTAHTPKVLLPVGGRPAIDYGLLAARIAGIERVIVVVPGGDDRVREHLVGKGVEFVVQPEPVGTADAIERGRAAAGVDRYAVLFPDHLNPPDHTGLRRLIEGSQTHPDASWIGLARRTSQMGPSTVVQTEPFCGYHRIVGLARGTPAESQLQTVYAEVRSPAYHTPVEDAADADMWGGLKRLARAGLFCGVDLGEVLDLGIPEGYAHACERLG